MFVTGSTVPDIIKEFNADLANVLRVCDAKQKHFDKLVKKGTMFPMRASSIITTTRKNRWVIWWEAQSRKNIEDLSIVTFVSILNFQRGRYAIMRSSYSSIPVYFIYTPHFFKRYAERFGVDETGEELIKRYFKLNSSYGFNFKRDDWFNISIENVYGSSSDGIAMGVRLNEKINVFLFKTFITYDMTKGKQIEDFSSAEELRQEMQAREYIM